MAKRNKKSTSPAAGDVEKKTTESSVSVDATVESKPTIPSETFEADGKEYKFVVAKFNLPGFGVMTAEEALENEAALATLVSVNAGVIQLVK